MVNRKTRKKTVRKMLCWTHYQFRRLVAKAEELGVLYFKWIEMKMALGESSSGHCLMESLDSLRRNSTVNCL